MRRAATVFILAFVPVHSAWPQTVAEEHDIPPILAIRPAPVQSESRSGAVVDWFPGISGFRVTGGVGDGPGKGGGRDRRGQLVPYVGLGWQGSLLEGRVLVGLDLGAFYQGQPDIRLNGGGGPDQDDAFHPEPDASSRLDPAISINLIYRF